LCQMDEINFKISWLSKGKALNFCTKGLGFETNCIWCSLFCTPFPFLSSNKTFWETDDSPGDFVFQIYSGAHAVSCSVGTRGSFTKGQVAGS
jgi:hypothetical protein